MFGYENKMLWFSKLNPSPYSYQKVNDFGQILQERLVEGTHAEKAPVLFTGCWT